MITEMAKTTVKLRYPANAENTKTAVCTTGYDGGLIGRENGIFRYDTAKIAGALAMSSADEAMLRENLGRLGYGDILTLHFDADSGEDTGVCVASRKRNGALEVAAVMRGTEGREWYSNFDIGYSSEHRGFSKAADFAEQKLGDYVFTRAIGMEPRYFITGYSRGGAVANILSKRLCDRCGTDSVAAYTFASPATTISRRTARYNSVFNLVRNEDFFTRVPLAGWGYTRYGRDFSLSGAGDITERYRAISGEEYIGFTHQAAVDNFLRAVMELAPNVVAYYKRRRAVGDRQLSLYEFMTTVADLLSRQPDDAAADVFMSAMISDYADLMSFLSSGADLMELISSSGIPRCSVADSHSPAAYMAALEQFSC